MAPCTIKWCGKNSQSSNFKKDGITFHRYPHDPDIKGIWIKGTRRENWFPALHSVVCSRHFTEDSFIYMSNRRRLLSSAVPTLYLPLLSNEINAQDPSSSTSRDVPEPINPDPSFKPLPPPTKVKKMNYPSGTSVSMPNLTVTSSKKKRFPGSPSDYTTPTKKRMCRRIIELSNKIVEKNKIIKNLGQKVRYMRKRLVSMKNILKEIENEMINSCNADLLRKIGITNRD